MFEMRLGRGPGPYWYINMEASARDCFMLGHSFPTLFLESVAYDNFQVKYYIRRTDLGISGYRIVKNVRKNEGGSIRGRVISGYIADDMDIADANYIYDKTDHSIEALRVILKGYLKIAILNLCIEEGFYLQENPIEESEKTPKAYDWKFPKELEDAISEFIDLEIAQLTK